MKPKKSPRAIVVIGDLHCGSSVGLQPPKVTLPDEQEVTASPIQRRIWSFWLDFWKWTEELLAGEPFVLVNNGDTVDGRHHHTLQLTSGNLSFQQLIAVAVLEPHVKKAAAYYQICGTPAHAGESSETEETVARELGAQKCGHQFTRQTLWVKMGKELIQFAHHIPTSSAHAYKSSPAMRLMAQAFADAGEWGLKPPTIMVRSHVHDYIEVKRPSCRVVVCPCWQAKTGFVWKKDTVTEPVMGGLIIREGQHGVHIRERIYRLPRPGVVTL